MRYPRLFTKLFCEPVMLEAAAFAGFANVLLSRMRGGEKFSMAGVTPDQLPDQEWLAYRKRCQATDQQARLDDVYKQVGSTAIITLDGAIGKHLSAMEMSCYGGCDLADIDRALALAASDRSVRSVVLDLRSPGGSVTGCPETAARVAALAKIKNVFAFTDSLCASAAYYIASQADQIFATRSARVGSIGVYCAILDASGWYAEENLKWNFFKDGEFKGMGLDIKPLSKDEAALFQNSVRQIGQMFRGAVTSKRPQVTLATMQGQCFYADTDDGDDAGAAGLIDGIVTGLDEVVAQLQ